MTAWTVPPSRRSRGRAGILVLALGASAGALWLSLGLLPSRLPPASPVGESPAATVPPVRAVRDFDPVFVVPAQREFIDLMAKGGAHPTGSSVITAYANWLERDPPAAIRWVLEQDDDTLAPPLRKELVWLFLAAEPELAGAALAAKPGCHVLGLVVQIWAQEDESAALDWVRSLAPDHPDRTASLGFIAEVWARRDLASLVSELPRMDGSEVRTELLTTAAAAWARLDAPSALAWAGGLTDNTERRIATEEILARWAESEPASALVWILRQPEGSEAEVALLPVVRQLVATTEEIPSLVALFRDEPQLRSALDSVLNEGADAP